MLPSFCRASSSAGGEELGDGALDALGRPGDVGQSLAALFLGEGDEAVEEAAGLFGAVADGQGADHALLREHLLEGVEPGLAEDVGGVLDDERDAQVRLVRAVLEHGVAVGDARVRRGGQRLGAELGEDAVDELLDHGEDFLLGDEGHLDVDLVELAGGAVGAGVLVAEAGGDLEVAVEPGDHEELLENLGRLRQGVELAGVQTARDQEVAGAFGGTARQDRGVVLQKAQIHHAAAHAGGDLGAQDDVGVHLFAAQVEEAVLEAQVLVAVAVQRHGEGSDLGFGEDFQGVADHFDVAGGELGVDGFGDAFDDAAGEFHHRFAAPLGAVLVAGGAGIDHDLGDAVMVAHINEDDAAMIAHPVHPTGDGDRLTDVGFAEFAAGMGPVLLHGSGVRRVAWQWKWFHRTGLRPGGSSYHNPPSPKGEQRRHRRKNPFSRGAAENAEERKGESIFSANAAAPREPIRPRFSGLP